MYVGLKQPRGDGERYVTPARAAAKETNHRNETQLNETFLWSLQLPLFQKHLRLAPDRYVSH